MDEMWHFFAMDKSGAFGIRDEHIKVVADEILRMGITEVSRNDFDRACWNCNIDPDNFNQRDLEHLKAELNA